MKKTDKKRTRFRLLVLPLIFVLIPLLPQKNTAEAAGSRVILNQGAFEEATVDWNVMVERLDEAIRNGKGENVNFSVGNIFTVPVDLLEKLAGQNATLALHANDEIAFSVSGRDVKRTDVPVHVEVCFEEVLPEEKAREYSGAMIAEQFYMTDREAYPCRINVHMALGAENSGRHAVLYSYDENEGTLRQEGVFRITKEGNAMFGLSRGDAYVTMIMGGCTVAPGDTLSHIALRHGISLKALKAANPQISDADMIHAGQLVNIPNL